MRIFYHSCLRISRTQPLSVTVLGKIGGVSQGDPSPRGRRYSRATTGRREFSQEADRPARPLPDYPKRVREAITELTPSVDEVKLGLCLAAGLTTVPGSSRANVVRISASSPSSPVIGTVLATPSLSASPTLSPAAHSVSPIAAKSDGSPLSVKAVVLSVSAIATLKTALSAPSVQSASDKPAQTQTAESRKQFAGEALRIDLSAPAVQANGEAKSVRAALAKKDGKGMPTPAALERYRRLLAEEKSMTN